MAACTMFWLLHTSGFTLKPSISGTFLSRKSMLQPYERLQSLEDTFSKPVNAGRKPGSVKRIRKDNVEPPLIIVDRTSTATAPSSFATTNSAPGAFNLSSVVA